MPGRGEDEDRVRFPPVSPAAQELLPHGTRDPACPVQQFQSFQKVRCSKCDHEASNSHTLREHRRKEHGEPSRRTAGWVMRQTSGFSEPKTPEDEEPPPSASCGFCPRVFTSFGALRRHWIRDHPQETGYEDFKAKSLDEREDFVRSRIEHDPSAFTTPLVLDESRQNTKFRLLQNTYSFAINEVGLEAAQMGYGVEMIAGVLRWVVAKAKDAVQPNERSLIGFTLDAACLDSSVVTGFTRVENFSADQLIEQVYALGTSDKHIELDDSLSIRVDVLNLDLDEGLFGVLDGLSRLEQLMRLTSVYGRVNVVNSHDCGPVAFALSQLKNEYGSKWRLKSAFKYCKLDGFVPGGEGLLRKVRRSRDLFDKTMEVVRLFEPEFDFSEPQGVAFLERLQEHMESLDPPQQLVCYEDQRFDKPLFAGTTIRPVKQRVHLLYLPSVQHICFVAEPEKLFRGLLCEDCLVIQRWRSKEEHRCRAPGSGKPCYKCGQDICDKKADQQPFSRVCPECSTYFTSRRCYNLHLLGAPERCASHATCEKCLLIVRRAALRSPTLKDHGCLEYKCKYCKELFRADDPEPHLCQVQPPSETELGGSGPGQPPPSFFRVYFDLETVKRGKDGHLEPYLLSAVFVCSDCVADVADPGLWRQEYPCCGKRKRLYWFEEGIRQFLLDTFGAPMQGPKQNRRKKGVCVAFNCRNFDGYFLISRLLSANASVAKTVLAGNRLMTTTFRGVKVKDLNLYCQVRSEYILLSLTQSVVSREAWRRCHDRSGWRALCGKASSPTPSPTLSPLRR